MSQKKQKGPEPDRLVIPGEWRDAMDKALKKKRPKEGWPASKDKEKPS